MGRQSAGIYFTIVKLDRRSDTPIYRQLYDGLRAAILTGQLAAGCRMPSSRSLAEDLRISRSTVLAAFDQLFAEGYIDGIGGSGTFVTTLLPDELVGPPLEPAAAPPSAERDQDLSRQSRSLAPIAATFLPVLTSQRKAPGRAFQIGAVDTQSFPRQIWGRLLSHRWRHSPHSLLNYDNPAGYWPLREAIGGYLGASRGVRCSPEQVIVVTGSQQAISLTARVLLDPGDSVWLEEPGYLGARAAFLGAGARLVPVPVDAEGIDVLVGQSRCPDARLIFVTPSHQFPLGTTMSLARRLALLDWAGRSGAWVLEDDYDSEFRYSSRPLAALQGLDTQEKVIYSGTFSKVMYPGLRLGYLVVPPHLVDAFTAARLFADMHSPTLDQVVLTDFINDGHFARHIRRMRTLYAERQTVLVDAAKVELTGALEIEPAEAGMHLVGWLHGKLNDREAARRASQKGVDTAALSDFSIEPVDRGALLLGYAGVEENEIIRGVHALASALV